MANSSLKRIIEGSKIFKAIWLIASSVLTIISFYLYFTHDVAQGEITSKTSSQNIQLDWRGLMIIAIIFWMIAFFLFWNKPKSSDYNK